MKFSDISGNTSFQATKWAIFVFGLLLLASCNSKKSTYEPQLGIYSLPNNIDRYLRVDSILDHLYGFENEAQKVDSLLFYTDLLQNYNEEIALVYAREAYSLADKNDWDEAQAYASHFVAMLKGRQEAFGEGIEDAMVDAKIGLELFQRAKNKPWEARTLILIGNFYYRKVQPDSSEIYYFRALQKVEEGRMDTQDSLFLMGEIYHELGLLYSINDPDKVWEYLQKSIDIYEKVGNQAAIARLKLVMAWHYQNKKNFPEAEKLIQESIDYSESSQDVNGLVKGLQGLGNLKLIQSDKGKNKDYLEEALQLYRRATLYQSENRYYSYEITGEAFQWLARADKPNRERYIDSSLIYYKKAMIEARSEGVLHAMKHMAENISNLCNYLQKKNRDCGKVMGISPADLFNQNYTGIVDTITQTLQGANQRIRSFELGEAEAVARRKRKTQLYISALVFLVGLLVFLFWLWRTQKQKLIREQTINERLQQVDKLKDQFLANTSHELRTPLNGIIGLSESLFDRVDDTGQQEDLSLIVSSGKRLSALVDDLLDFSKLKNSDIELAKKPLDLHSLVEVVLRISSPLTAGRDVQLVNAIPKDLQAVFADEDRLMQILHNLIGNAIKFTEKGKVEVEAEIDVGNSWEMMKIQVIDTGIGIPKEKHETIFEEFKQADGSTSRQFGGTGLGLTVSKQLVTLHKGEIGVESEVGKGTIIWFTLPLSREKGKITKLLTGTTGLTKPRPSKESLEMVISPTMGKTGNIRILVVDDEPINQQVLKNHLDHPRFQIEFAANGEETLEILAHSPTFDLVLLDVMMPKMSGYEACEKIRKQYLSSELPIIMVTAKNQVVDLVQGLQLGANDYLAKPFSKQEFLARVNTQLDLHRIFNIAGRFVPNEFLHVLGHDSITKTQLGDQAERRVTVMFCDIRDYTTLSETMTPEENFKFVNSFHGRMGPIIKKNNGFVNQYLGDGMMSIFPGNPEDAVHASIQMNKILQVYNAKRKSQQRRQIRIGIGMHFGSLIMGIIGDEKRMDAATISDVVNTAARIESLTKHYGVNILLSEAGLSQISDQSIFHVRYLGPVQVKGKKELVKIYECFDGDSPEMIKKKLETLSEFRAGTQFYFAKYFAAAAVTFDNIVKKNPRDRVAQHFLHKVGGFLQSGVPKNWSGVEEMSNK